MRKNKADLVLLLFVLIKCPHIEKKIKEKERKTLTIHSLKTMSMWTLCCESDRLTPSTGLLGLKQELLLLAQGTLSSSMLVCHGSWNSWWHLRTELTCRSGAKKSHSLMATYLQDNTRLESLAHRLQRLPAWIPSKSVFM